jgi:N-acetylglucosaminyl-diphospho-decaprenol L-rhamnosyltransferase
LLLLHWRRGDVAPAIRGIKAALKREDLDQVLADRRMIQAKRKASPGAILRVMSIDPAAFIGRRFVIRKWKDPRSAGA